MKVRISGLEINPGPVKTGEAKIIYEVDEKKDEFMLVIDGDKEDLFVGMCLLMHKLAQCDCPGDLYHQLEYIEMAHKAVKESLVTEALTGMGEE